MGEGCVARCHYINYITMTMTVHVKLKECHIFDYLFFFCHDDDDHDCDRDGDDDGDGGDDGDGDDEDQSDIGNSCAVIEFYCSSPDGSSVGFLFSGPSKYPIVHNVERTFQVKLG